MSQQKTLPALTLRHPWPFAIAHLSKRVENRTWRAGKFQLAPGEYLAIHGGVRPKGDNLEEACDDLQSLINRGLAPDHLTLDDTIIEGVVAVVRFAGYVTESDDPWFSGPVGWAFDQVVALPEPVEIKGSQGIWPLPDRVIVEVRRQFKMVMSQEQANA